MVLAIPEHCVARCARWYLVQTLAKRECQAQWHLHAQGFRTFLPQFQKTVRHARKLRTVKAPLFPGYLFTLLDLERDRWLCVRSTVGVARLFSNRDGRPTPLPIGIVETLIEQSEDDVTRLDNNLRQGQNVRILSGPFAELVGTLIRLDDSQRVQVLLKMMGASVPVVVNRAVLAPAA